MLFSTLSSLVFIILKNIPSIFTPMVLNLNKRTIRFFLAL
jgi:hypothetical protein